MQKKKIKISCQYFIKTTGTSQENIKTTGTPQMMPQQWTRAQSDRNKPKDNILTFVRCGLGYNVNRHMLPAYLLIYLFIHYKYFKGPKALQKGVV